MNGDILKTAVKIARVIDDNVERDNSLSCIAQIQAAANLPENALETIEFIRSSDIRADAVRKSLDNLQTRFFSKNESMLQINMWLEKLMEETMSIPEIDVRCPKLNAINLLILSRLEDKEKAQVLLKQTRDEFARLSIGKKRCKYLFAAYQLFQQIGNEAEAIATLECILDGITEYEPIVEQGLIIGLTAYEVWKIQGRNRALEYIQRYDNPTVQSHAYLQLAELLAVSGNFKDAQQIAEYLNDEEQKSSCDHFIDMGKSLIRNASEMKGAVICINKSLYFSKKPNKNESDYSFHEKPRSFPRPVWFSLAVSIMPKENSDSHNADKEDESSVDSDDTVLEQSEENSIQETDWDNYDWDGFDWENVKKKNDNMGEELWNNSDSDDEDWDESTDGDEEDWEESDEEESESWKESDDDESESWKESDEDESESWKESDADDSESWKESDDDDNAENESKDDDEKMGIPKFLEEKQREFLKKFANIGFNDEIHKILLNRLNHRNDSSVDDAPKDRFFCMTESVQGIVSFNRTLPPSLYQHFIRRLTMFFPLIKKGAKERMTPQIMEKIEDYITRQIEIGFDDAWQEVISQGDYPFAVECALNYFCFQNKEDLIFGFE